MEIITSVSDDTYRELSKLTGQKIVSFTLWDDSLADALTEKESPPDVESGANVVSCDADIDLYLQEGVYFELYSAQFYPDIYSEPLATQAAIEKELSALIEAGVWLDAIAVDENSQLVLILSQQHLPHLYILISGWILNGWEELPE